MKFLYLRIVMLILADNILTAIGGVPSVFGALFLRDNDNKQIEVNSIDETQNEMKVAESKIAALRIEFIKNQILKKLRLKERPLISVGELPKPLIVDDEYGIFSRDDEEFPNVSDYYGKTQQVVIFPNKDKRSCKTSGYYPASCLSFQMPDDVAPSDVSNVELWIHKNKNIGKGGNHTVVISEELQGDAGRTSRKSVPVIDEITLKDGWTKLDVSSFAKKWLQIGESKLHGINIVCKTCDSTSNVSAISDSTSTRPFIIIHTDLHRQKVVSHRRKKRSANCSEGFKECCRESLYVSFADIGWGDWMINPPGYNAYFCKGSCTTPSALTMSASDHSSILQKLMYRGIQPEFTSCCAATHFKPLQVLYLESNSVVRTKLLSNMIVENCGCM